MASYAQLDLFLPLHMQACTMSLHVPAHTCSHMCNSVTQSYVPLHICTCSPAIDTHMYPHTCICACFHVQVYSHLYTLHTDNCAYLHFVLSPSLHIHTCTLHALAPFLTHSHLHTQISSFPCTLTCALHTHSPFLEHSCLSCIHTLCLGLLQLHMCLQAYEATCSLSADLALGTQ